MKWTERGKEQRDEERCETQLKSDVNGRWDFPGGTVVKNPSANAGGHRFEPWSRKIPHAAEQLSPCATATEPAL